MKFGRLSISVSLHTKFQLHCTVGTGKIFFRKGIRSRGGYGLESANLRGLADADQYGECSRKQGFWEGNQGFGGWGWIGRCGGVAAKVYKE